MKQAAKKYTRLKNVSEGAREGRSEGLKGPRDGRPTRAWEAFGDDPVSVSRPQTPAAARGAGRSN